MQPPDSFLTEAAALGIEFDPGDVERIGRYLGLLLEANESINLTAITDPGLAWSRHVLDALSLVPVIASVEAAGALLIADIGSGGGVPAIPLAIVLPDARFTLIESTGKKCGFLQATAEALELGNVRIVNDRSETVARDPAFRERFDIVTTRALGHLGVVLELAAPLLKVGGISIAVKGAKAETEVAESEKAAKMLGMTRVEIVTTPTGRLVLHRKDGPTPRTYPRAPGMAANHPLGRAQASRQAPGAVGQ